MRDILRIATYCGLKFVPLCGLLLVPTEVLAAGGGEHHGHGAALSTLFWPVANFMLYILLLTVCYFKLIKPRLADQKNALETELDSSAQAVAQAENDYSSVKQRLELIATEKSALRKLYQAEAERGSEAVAANARRSIKDLEQDSQRRIAGELKRAKSEIRDEVVSQALDIARQRLRVGVSDEDNVRLREQTLTALS